MVDINLHVESYRKGGYSIRDRLGRSIHGGDPCIQAKKNDGKLETLDLDVYCTGQPEQFLGLVLLPCTWICKKCVLPLTFSG
jgi:hypothetical protein